MRGDDGQPVVADYATALADGLDAALAGWVVRCVTTVMGAWAGVVDVETLAAATEAGERCRHQIGGEIRRMLDEDIDHQRGTPLAVLRRAVSYPTEVLAAAGVPPVERDRFAEQMFPEDRYNLSPATYGDIDPSLADLGLAWGAAKAFEHKKRHRPG